MSEASPTRRNAALAFRIATTVLGLAFLLARPDLRLGASALTRFTPAAACGGLVVLGLAIVASTMRWRLLLGSRSTAVPAFPELLALNAAGLFYAIVLPGAIGGDVIRAVATRDVAHKPTDAIIVVVVERASAISALALLGLPLLATSHLGVSGPVLLKVFAATVALGATATLAARRPVWGFAAWQLAAAVALSAASQALTAACGWLLVADLEPLSNPAGVLGALVIAQIVAMVPSLIGLGPGQAALVLLLEPLGVSSAHAGAMSLAYWALGLFWPIAGAAWYARSGLGAKAQLSSAE